MADDEQPLTKRERQKQRKQAKREAERAAQRRQRRRKIAATAVVAVVVAAALGGAGFLWQQSRAERAEFLSGEAQAAQDAGCQAVEEPADLGGQHLGAQSGQLTQAPPSEIYDHRPATSGPHIGGAAAATGIYEQHVDERLLVHNLEHGYVVVWYSPELGDDERAELLEWGETAVADEPLLIVAEYPEPLPDGGKVAHVAWGYRQLCDDFDPDVAGAFLDRYTNFEAPEIGVGPHDESDGLVPGQDPVVFPPLQDSGGQGQIEDEAEGEGEDHGGSDDGDGAAEDETDSES